jgi:hypothetical protein
MFLLFLSSSSSNTKPGILGVGTCTISGGTGGWLCQHRDTAISGMVGFRNNVGSAALTNWVSPQSQQIAFGRGVFNLDNVFTSLIPYRIPWFRGY